MGGSLPADRKRSDSASGEITAIDFSIKRQPPRCFLRSSDVVALEDGPDLRDVSSSDAYDVGHRAFISLHQHEQKMERVDLRATAPLRFLLGIHGCLTSPVIERYIVDGFFRWIQSGAEQGFQAFEIHAGNVEVRDGELIAAAQKSDEQVLQSG